MAEFFEIDAAKLQEVRAWLQSFFPGASPNRSKSIWLGGKCYNFELNDRLPETASDWGFLKFTLRPERRKGGHKRESQLWFNFNTDKEQRIGLTSITLQYRHGKQTGYLADWAADVPETGEEPPADWADFVQQGEALLRQYPSDPATDFTLYPIYRKSPFYWHFEELYNGVIKRLLAKTQHWELTSAPEEDYMEARMPKSYYRLPIEDPFNQGPELDMGENWEPDILVERLQDAGFSAHRYSQDSDTVIADGLMELPQNVQALLYFQFDKRPQSEIRLKSAYRYPVRKAGRMVKQFLDTLVIPGNRIPEKVSEDLWAEARKKYHLWLARAFSDMWQRWTKAAVIPMEHWQLTGAPEEDYIESMAEARQSMDITELMADPELAETMREKLSALEYFDYGSMAWTANLHISKTFRPEDRDDDKEGYKSAEVIFGVTKGSHFPSSSVGQDEFGLRIKTVIYGAGKPDPDGVGMFQYHNRTKYFRADAIPAQWPGLAMIRPSLDPAVRSKVSALFSEAYAKFIELVTPERLEHWELTSAPEEEYMESKLTEAEMPSYEQAVEWAQQLERIGWKVEEDLIAATTFAFNYHYYNPRKKAEQAVFVSIDLWIHHGTPYIRILCYDDVNLHSGRTEYFEIDQFPEFEQLRARMTPLEIDCPEIREKWDAAYDIINPRLEHWQLTAAPEEDYMESQLTEQSAERFDLTKICQNQSGYERLAELLNRSGFQAGIKSISGEPTLWANKSVQLPKDGDEFVFNLGFFIAPNVFSIEPHFWEGHRGLDFAERRLIPQKVPLELPERIITPSLRGWTAFGSARQEISSRYDPAEGIPAFRQLYSEFMDVITNPPVEHWELTSAPEEEYMEAINRDQAIISVLTEVELKDLPANVQAAIQWAKGQYDWRFYTDYGGHFGVQGISCVFRPTEGESRLQFSFQPGAQALKAIRCREIDKEGFNFTMMARRPADKLPEIANLPYTLQELIAIPQVGGESFFNYYDEDELFQQFAEFYAGFVRELNPPSEHWRLTSAPEEDYMESRLTEADEANVPGVIDLSDINSEELLELAKELNQSGFRGVYIGPKDKEKYSYIEVQNVLPVQGDPRAKPLQFGYYFVLNLLRRNFQLEYGDFESQVGTYPKEFYNLSAIPMELPDWFSQIPSIPEAYRNRCYNALAEVYHRFINVFQKMEHWELTAAPEEDYLEGLVDSEIGSILSEAARPFRKTVKAYKLFRTKGGQLYPLFVLSNESIPIGVWVKAKSGPAGKTGGVKSKLGQLAYRPGFHAGDLPIALHIGGKSRPGIVKPDYRPDNQVWALVEMPAEVDWQSVARANARITKAGTPHMASAHITDQVPFGGYYRYKTNPNMVGEWLISGDMKVIKVLSDEEVKAVNAKAGLADLPRLEELEAQDFEAYEESLGESLEEKKDPREIEAEKEDRRLAAIDRERISEAEQEIILDNQRKALAWLKAHPEVHPLSAHYYLLGHGQFGPEVTTKRGVGEHFYRPQAQRLIYSREGHRQEAADALTHDIMHALAGTPKAGVKKGEPSKAFGWYDRAVRKTLDKIGEIEPAILVPGSDDRLAYQLALAITSQGQDVFPNAESALQAYRYWKRFKKLPEESKFFGGGTKAPAMEANFKKVNADWETLGTEEFLARMRQSKTVAELREAGIKITGESVNHVTYGAMYLGPKIGSFFLNLTGNFEPTTMDLWFSRTMNRMSGNMFKFSDAAYRSDRTTVDKKTGKERKTYSYLTVLESLLGSGEIRIVDQAQQAEMRREIQALRAVPEGKLTRPRALKLAPLIHEWADKAHKMYKESIIGANKVKRSYHPERASAENVLAKKMDQRVSELADAPRGARERWNWRDIMERVAANLKEAGIVLTNADLQALPWFEEKNLFRHANVPSKVNADYLDAAYRLVRRVKEGPQGASPVPDLIPNRQSILEPAT